MTERSRAITNLLAIGMLCATACSAHAQIEYDVTVIPEPPDSFNDIPSAVSPDGTVVGWAQFSPAFPRAWRWTETTGTELLPAPRDSNVYAAIDINATGTIAGDTDAFGAPSFVWLFDADQQFVFFDPPDGYQTIYDPSINSVGQVVATAYPEVGFLHQAVLRDPDGTVTLLDASLGIDINDAGQMLVSDGVPDYRIEPDGSRTFVPGVNSVMNELGHTAGVYSCGDNCNQPYFWSDETGQILIGRIASEHSVTGLSNEGQVVGRVTEGTARGWIWQADKGTRLLQDLIDPALQIQIHSAWAINDAGQVTATGVDLDEPGFPDRVLLLTPIGACDADFNEDELVNTQDVIDFLAAWAAREPAGDFDDNGLFDTRDLLGFLNVWAAGC